MRTSHLASLVGISLFVSIQPLHAAEDIQGGEHVIVEGDEVTWNPAPPVLPAGAEAALLFGDPSREGPFALRLKFPAGYRVAPHSHPVQETVTILSGTFKLGMGKVADPAKTKALRAGSFFSLPPDHAHYVFTDEETVIQINTVGPWGLKYMNPEDDPRQQQASQ